MPGVSTVDQRPVPPNVHDGADRQRRNETTEHLLRCLAEAREPAAQDRLRDEIVLLNITIAESIAARYRRRGAEQEDLVQVARLALVKAVDRYDPERGNGFITFAVPTIAGEVKRYFRDYCWDIRPTRRIQELQHAVASSEAELSQELGRSPTAAELADRLGVDYEAVVEALSCDGYYNLVPLDAPTGSMDSTAVIDRIGAADPHLDAVETHEMLAPLLAGLTDREQRLLTMRFDQGLTQTQIAQEMGISQMQVSRLLKASYERLRRRLEDGS